MAVGDISDIKEQKMIGKVGAYADLVAGNIVALLEGKSDLKEYKGTFEGIFITIGKVRGLHSLRTRCLNTINTAWRGWVDGLALGDDVSCFALRSMREAQWRFYSFGDWTVSNIKSKGLFVNISRKNLGLSPI